MIELIIGAAALFFLTKKKNGSSTTTTTTPTDNTRPGGKNDRPSLNMPPNPGTKRESVINTGSGTSQGSGVNTQQSAGSGKRNRPDAL
jgi:hypothetical protein